MNRVEVSIPVPVRSFPVRRTSRWCWGEPEEQIAQVDTANLKRFQAMIARAMRT
ncbi:MAG: hypothetical protein Q8R63_10575 [Ramlibacter sp.]|nr:hypothetical protein [Ramlibacter sp.]